MHFFFLKKKIVIKHLYVDVKLTTIRNTILFYYNSSHIIIIKSKTQFRML